MSTRWDRGLLAGGSRRDRDDAPPPSTDYGFRKRPIDPFVGIRARILRERRGWRQRDLAQIADVAVSSVTGLEVGRRVRPRNFDKIARALGTTVDDLQNPNAPHELEPHIFLSMSAEDVRVAREFHDATTNTRSGVLDLLRTGRGDLTLESRIRRLPAASRAAVIDLLESEERAAAAEETPRNKKKRE